jgi:hypothetical protein
VKLVENKVEKNLTSSNGLRSNRANQVIVTSTTEAIASQTRFSHDRVEGIKKETGKSIKVI